VSSKSCVPERRRRARTPRLIGPPFVSADLLAGARGRDKACSDGTREPHVGSRFRSTRPDPASERFARPLNAAEERFTRRCVIAPEADVAVSEVRSTSSACRRFVRGHEMAPRGRWFASLSRAADARELQPPSSPSSFRSIWLLHATHCPFARDVLAPRPRTAGLSGSLSPHYAPPRFVNVPRGGGIEPPIGANRWYRPWARNSPRMTGPTMQAARWIIGALG